MIDKVLTVVMLLFLLACAGIVAWSVMEAYGLMAQFAGLVLTLVIFGMWLTEPIRERRR